MRYSDLITFESVDSVKQLRAAGSASQALEDVRTYVISEKMSEQLAETVLPNLRFDNPEVDHRGLLLVATYGTGKTHLMSVLAAVAEDADLTSQLTDARAAQAATGVAGKFKVIRVEIGATRMNLRDILAEELAGGLAELGVSYEFPPLDKVTNNKRPLQEMMAAFAEIYPDHGLLLVVDELLDFLRARRDTELILDLGFLRELGEFCRDERFRFIAGVQETIFDNPRFIAVQDEVRRVRERFVSFRIAREDIAYVVQRRILGKSAEQKNRIREHLGSFAPAFESLAGDIETFVELFPVHPAYLKTFEALSIVEKRRVLSSLSEQIRRRLDAEVPSAEPGMISFDTYRAELDEDKSNRVIPEVRDVLRRSEILRSHVERNLEVPTDVAPALRIVDALAVHRLTTDDLDAPIGLTVDDLRDDLCLVPPGTPELDASFLADSIEALVQEISKAVSGQFISINETNGQIYLDLKKDVDYEQQVNERAESLDADALDRAYYSALSQLLDVVDTPYVHGYPIWAYELPWAAKKVTRPGYLFFGAPNQRSTAQPARDFYLYFLQPYAPHKFEDPLRADEVFFRLEEPDEEFTTSLRRYEAALMKIQETTQQHKQHFRLRADRHFGEIKSWLRDNLATRLTVTYQGERKTVAQWLAEVPGSRGSLKEQLDSIAVAVLGTHFATRYPSYPTFPEQVTAANLVKTAQAALAQLTGRDTTLGRSTLTALALRGSDGEINDSGPFAKELLQRLGQAGGSALNDSDLLVERDPGVRTWGSWHLEPIWLVLVAAALTYLGRAELGFASGQKITAANLDNLVRMSGDDLQRLAFVTTPAGADSATLTRIATLLGLPPALGHGEVTPDTTAKFVERADAAYTTAGVLKAYVQSTPRLWGEELFDDPSGRQSRLTVYLDVLADVRARDTAGKLKRLSLDQAKLDAADAGKKELGRVDELKRVSEHLAPVVRYLEDASNVLGGSDPFREAATQVRAKLREVLRAPALDKNLAAAARQAAEELRGQYRAFAVERHTADRLPASGDADKQRLVNGPLWRDLQALGVIELLPGGQFGVLEARLVGLTACKQFAPQDYDTSYTCPHCGYRPNVTATKSAQAQLKSVESQAKELWASWVATLRDSVSEPEIIEQLNLLDGAEQEDVRALLEDRLAPGGVTPGLVSGVTKLIRKFEILRVSRADLLDTVFPGGQAATVEDVAKRFEAWLKLTTAKVGGDNAGIRLVLDQEKL